MSIDALIRKFIKAAKPLLEEMTSNNYRWSSERATLKKGGIYDINKADI